MYVYKHVPYLVRQTKTFTFKIVSQYFIGTFVAITFKKHYLTLHFVIFQAVSEIMIEVTQLAAGLTDQSLESIAALRRDSVFDQTLILNHQQSWNSSASSATNNHQRKPKEEQTLSKLESGKVSLVKIEENAELGPEENGVETVNNGGGEENDIVTMEDVPQVLTTDTSAKSVCSSTSRISV